MPLPLIKWRVNAINRMNKSEKRNKNISEKSCREILFHFCRNHYFCPSVSNSQWDITFIDLCRNSPCTIRCSSVSSGDWINNASPPRGDARSKSKQEWNEWVDSCGNWTLTCGNNSEISFPIDSREMTKTTYHIFGITQTHCFVNN